MNALQALQATLAGEHAALYVYGALGGRTSQSASPALFAALRQGYDVHRAQRDQIARNLRDLGSDPVAAAVSYEVSGPLGTAGQVRRAAIALEGRCAASYTSLVSQSAGEQRRRALTALVDCAVRQLALGAEPEAFPGIDELADRGSSQR